MKRAPFEGQERVAVTAGVLNRSATAVSDVALQLELEGRVIQTLRVSVGPNQSATASFTPVAVANANTRAAVRIADGAGQKPDALARDNVFYFVLSPAAPVPVMLVTQGGRSDANLYLARALGIGEAPRFQASLQAVRCPRRRGADARRAS